MAPDVAALSAMRAGWPRSDPVSFARRCDAARARPIALWWWLRARRLAACPGPDERRPAAAGAAERPLGGAPPVTLRSACLAPGSSPRPGPASGPRAVKRAARGSPSCWPWNIRPHARRKTSRRRTASTSRSRRHRVRAGTARPTVSARGFAGQALTQCPSRPTTRCWSRRCVSCTRACLRTGPRSVRRSARRPTGCGGARQSKVLVLLTDGVNNKGTVIPRTAGQAAAAPRHQDLHHRTARAGRRPCRWEYGQRPVALRDASGRNRRAALD